MKQMLIFSYGLRPGQVTLETLAAMRKCGVVYSHCLDADTARQFRGYARRLLLTGRLGLEGTAEAAAAALEEHDTVGFLTYGNPLFLNRTVSLLSAAAARRKAQVRVFPAVSSFDALVNLFDLNKFSLRGLRLVDAAASLDAPSFDPGMDTLVFVPYVLNLRGRAAARKKFLAAAAAAYPPDAMACLADCYAAEGGRDRVLSGTVGDLRRLLAKARETSTLFIPAPGGKRGA